MRCSLAVCYMKIEADTEYLRRCTGKLLRDAIISFESGCSDSDPLMQLKYYVRLPDPKTHVNHVLQEVVSSLFVLALLISTCLQGSHALDYMVLCAG